MDDPPQPKSRFVLKPRDVEAFDKVARPGDGTAISVKLIHQVNQIAEGKAPGRWSGDLMTPPEEGKLDELPSVFKPKEITPMDRPSAASGDEAISVPGMLHRNHAAAVKSEPELIAMPPKRRSRRNRDFLLLVGSALLSVGLLGIIFRDDRQMVALSLFGVVFTTVILAWVMYGIMDRY
jgi:hypothetical protein